MVSYKGWYHMISCTVIFLFSLLQRIVCYSNCSYCVKINFLCLFFFTSIYQMERNLCGSQCKYRYEQQLVRQHQNNKQKQRKVSSWSL
ncbi:unnamed protein product [Rotaria sordida]|uniref:Secreted protein n=1 Tax=Rotaria sordida TaxID=392033 RepID=A0A814UXN0_9BILA|nr:unnamed protein product [Rotaria sordida]CAF1227222.1 unnamed protein product [Rotaria sordida]CAF1300728.1 unnamed protein product [Rotaria sordida]CAF1508478.1 unnamed protein product [Rotaria sordida]